MRPLLAALLSACLFILGCGGGGGGADLGGGACGALAARSGSDNQQIFNGESCNQVARTAVVAIFPIASDGEQLGIAGICTGTLVTVDNILTSAHCFVDPVLSFGEAIVGFVALVGGQDGEVIAFSDARIHPLYTGAVGSQFDVAMATLSRVPSPQIGPVPILSSQTTAPGQEFSVFGYGTNNRGQVGELKSAEFVIEDFIGGNLVATLSGSGNASICGGDSGGPAVQVVNGVTTLIGVNSFGLFLGGVPCPDTPATLSGFVDIQNAAVIDFIVGYAPDVAFQ